MTNKEKLEIIDKKLDELFEFLNKNVAIDLLLNDYKQLTQAIHNLNNLETLKINVLSDYEKEEENKQTLITPSTTYICPKCKKEVIVYGKFLSGMCYDCNHKLVKKK